MRIRGISLVIFMKPTLIEKLAPPAGLEPATYGLTVHRSTD